ncbi:MAG: ADP-glyceromanno-heptose 6-epimerase [Verrucomicrobia bacterium]|nr:ADP-glyceromanno-heptose 6-epimerase [Verrucomicrobiota bacterium]MBV9299211.1 ADP-glyceromanno-heptose 6-epimerase [Verrucomicrobiota bacterium]MBV9645562.1 ADP-glyceromanno-heptose 6-epimerase [Verrucomicrobiota bacterium]
MNELEKGKILLTGGAGFIGSALLWGLNRLGLQDILVCDQLGEDEKWQNLAPLSFDDYVSSTKLIELVEADSLILKEVRWVFHLGACSATTELDAGYLMENNYRYTKMLCDWALAHDARFVYASSAATYGDGAKGMMDDETVVESLRPLNPYGYSKQIFDRYAKQKALFSKIVGLKYFNVFGPNEWHKGEMRSLVNKAYDQVLETGKIRLFKSYKPAFKDGEQKRDFLYVKDAVDMTIHLAVTRSAHGLFNLGCGKARTWVDLANAVFAALSRLPQIEFIEMPEVIRERYQYFTQANIEKLKATGYRGPKFTLEQAVTDYVQNYLVPRRHMEI